MLFKEREIQLVAASADSQEKAKEMAEGMGLTFPVGYGIDAEKIHEATGATLDAKHKIIQPAAFILKPGGIIAVTVYSSWAVGRLRPEEVFGAIHFLTRSIS